MAMKSSLSGDKFVEAIPKKTLQGRGKHTKYSATSANKPKKRYRGQGRGQKKPREPLFLSVVYE